MWEILFEKIKAWDGVSDTGKDARLKIERNFEKIRAFFEGNLKILVESKADLVDGKVPVGQVPLIGPGMITSAIEDYSWGSLISKEGNWYMKDHHNMSRPLGLPNPPEGEIILYAAHSMGFQEGHIAILLVNVETLDSYIVRMDNYADHDQWWAEKVVFGKELVLKADLVDGKVPVDQVPLIGPGMITSAIEDYSWGSLISKEGNWYMKDHHNMSRPLGLPNPLEGEIILYAAHSMGFQEGHIAIILVNVETLDSYIVRIANGADHDQWWAEKVVFGKDLLLKADLVDGKVPVDQVPLIGPGMITSKNIPLEDSSWGDIISQEGNWYIRDKYGLDRPHGLPSPAEGDVITYSACSICKQEGHMTTILTNVDTMDTYIVEIANGAYGDSWWAKRLVFADELGNINAVLDILNGDLVGDVQEVLDNMTGV